MSEQITINEVGPRDGLQSQAKHLSLEQRIRLVEALLAANIKHLEAGSFVSPKAVPQMAGTDQLLQGIKTNGDTHISVLVPNMKGYQLATAAGARHVAAVLSATQTMNQKNIGMSLEQVISFCNELIARAAEDGVSVQVYLAVAFECPYEGAVDAGSVRQLASDLIQRGVDEVVIADTIGAANPQAVAELMDALVKAHGASRFSCHFHDTRAMGLANVYAAIKAGIRKFDSSIGGLGGCPFAPGASGNVATEDVVMMCEQMGFSTGIDMPKLLDAVALVAELTGNCKGGRAHYWLTNNATGIN